MTSSTLIPDRTYNWCLTSNRKNYWFRLTFILVFLLPFLRYYDLPLINISLSSALFFFILVIAFIAVITSKNREGRDCLKASRIWLLLFLAWMVLMTSFALLNTNTSLSGSVNSIAVVGIVGLIMFLIMNKSFDYRSFFSVYSFFVAVVIIVYLTQWGMYFFGISISLKLPLLSFSDSWAGLETTVFGMNPLPSSLFSEKSHFCVFVLPFLALQLFNGIKGKLFIIRPFFLSLVLISTVSGSGIVGLAITWIIYVLFAGNFPRKNRLGIVLTGCLACLGVFLVLMTVPAFNSMFSELFVVSSDLRLLGYTTKADYRIYRGFDIFSKLPAFNKITGVGYNMMEPFSKTHHIVSVFDKEYLPYEYFSMITAVLLYSGLIGFMFFAAHILCLFLRGDKVTRGLIILFIAIMFSTCMLFVETHIIYLAAIVFSVKRFETAKRGEQ